jgi:RND family efflux transporter MFP subunit
MIKKTIGIIIIILLIVGGVRLIKHKKAVIAQTPLPASGILAVKTTLISHGTFPISKTLMGRIIAKQQVALAARITSHILSVSMREGSTVKKGELLVQLDDRREKDRVAAARAELAAAKTQSAAQQAIFVRDQKLFAAQAISQETIDQSLASRDAARARVTALQRALDTAITDLSYTVIIAPADGIITGRLVDPGDLATPGKPLLRFEEQQAGYYIQLNIPQADFAKLTKGDPVKISPDSFSKATAVTAQISRIHPAISLGTLATLEIDIPKRPFNLPTGGTVKVSIVGGMATGWHIPSRAVLENVNKSYVFTVDENNLVHIIAVTIQGKSHDWLIIDGPLNKNSRIIVAQESALLRLHEKQQVKVIQ